MIKILKHLYRRCFPRKEDIENFIFLMRGKYTNGRKHYDYKSVGELSEYIFTRGDCWRFALLAKEMFPMVKFHQVWDEYNDIGHILVYYKDIYFDITGVFTEDEFEKRFTIDSYNHPIEDLHRYSAIKMEYVINKIQDEVRDE